MRRLKAADPGFGAEFAGLLLRGTEAARGAEEAVRPILEAVRREGDAALCRLTKEFDRFPLAPEKIRVGEEEVEEALRALPQDALSALAEAARRIRRFHEEEKPRSFRLEAEGESLGIWVRPLGRVGLYAPGGKAAYPSTVLMTAIPAAVAGVGEVVLCTPPGPGGKLPPSLLAAARLAGVHRVFRVGGAQAIAALAYGTESVPACDKVVGPGNVYVAAAKRLVFGRVDIDLEAGPSEVVVVTDGSCPARWAAADLLAQAEHDEEALAVCLAVGEEVAEEVDREVEALLRDAPRKGIIREALRRRGAVISVRDLEEAAELANRLAPEHLELLVEGAEEAYPRFKNAGAIFLGPFSPVAAGDYAAGPNHVLPTGGTARFASPLGVWDFVKRTSVVRLDRRGLELLAEIVLPLAHLEGLPAHAEAVRIRSE